MKKLLTIAVALLSMSSWGYEKKDMLTKKADLETVKASLVMNQKWVQYPKYADREGWAKFAGKFAPQLIAAGEKALDYKWQVVPATAYLEFERSGNRDVMQNPYNQNITAITNLLYAELAEGKGRFTDQLINGVFSICEMTSWGLSAHLVVMRKGRSLPSHEQNIIELTQGNLSSLLSWTYYFMKDTFDKVDPIISQRLYYELNRRMLEPYMNESNYYWWQAFKATPTTMVNNWNPWCNFNVLQCFMLLENDRDKLAKAVYRTMSSVDKFIDYSKSDGACEEGPSYWGHAAGKMYDYLQALAYITGGKVAIFDKPQIKAMGEYIAKSYVGSGWVVNFADASAKGGGEAALIYRYGNAVQSDMMINYAATIAQKPEKLHASNDVFRTFQEILNADQFAQVTAKSLSTGDTWYPETEFCFINDEKSGFFLASKGGYNNESHNHNDAGTFSLYLNHTPIFIDAGVGTYTRQTFSSERYDIWSMQSNYHSLPMINGVPQAFGGKYKAANCKFDARKKTFSLDIAGAYPEAAQVKSYQRSYTVAPKGITIEDNFALNSATAPNQVNFMTWGDVDIATPGKVVVQVQGKKVEMSYNPKQFKATIQTIKQDDPRLSSVWGEKIYRISLDALSMPTTGKYTFTITAI